MDAETEVVVDVVDSDGLDEEEGRGKVIVVGGTVSVVVAGVSSECISSITLLCILEIKIRKEAEGRKGVKKEKGREKKRRQEGRKGHTCLSQSIFISSILMLGVGWQDPFPSLWLLFLCFLSLCLFGSGGGWRRGRRGYRWRGSRSRGR